jgi:hypothetical protein
LANNLESLVVFVGVLANVLDNLPVAVGRLLVLASGFIDHAEAIVAVVHFGEAHQEVADGVLCGLVELTGTDEVGGVVGRGRQLVFSDLDAGELGKDCSFRLTKLRAVSIGGLGAHNFGLGKPLALGCLLFGQAALLVLLATAAVVRLAMAVNDLKIKRLVQNPAGRR